jgi:hypothetical protein
MAPLPAAPRFFPRKDEVGWNHGHVARPNGTTKSTCRPGKAQPMTLTFSFRSLSCLVNASACFPFGSLLPDLGERSGARATRARLTAAPQFEVQVLKPKLEHSHA